jgi:mono/diheme cytochrome c family protein
MISNIEGSIGRESTALGGRSRSVSLAERAENRTRACCYGPSPTHNSQLTTHQAPPRPADFGEPRRGAELALPVVVHASCLPTPGEQARRLHHDHEVVKAVLRQALSRAGALAVLGRAARSGVILALLLTCFSGCDLPGRPKLLDRYVPPREERAFGALYAKNCAGCHGADGKLGPALPLNDKLFLALMPDAEIKRVITAGRDGTLMPAFAVDHGGQLVEEQVDVLAKGIRQRWGSVEPAPKGAPPYLISPRDSASGSSGHGDQNAGVAVFRRACVTCHGQHGEGMKGEEMNAGAINDPNFLALISDQALRRIIITGRRDLGMPDYADAMGRPDGFQPLSAQDVTNLTALLAQWRKTGDRNRGAKGK